MKNAPFGYTHPIREPKVYLLNRITLLDGDWHFVSVVGMFQHFSYN